ncbi:hypothetical protein jhhlp_005799 [Lomentospora prolificans]|uniref:HD domain-containing protein n=1 Tax=Lomentospora prolificans TaxID=41688 RepID=A0A2N3N448_9PEZI|nr:hypothetical protein jhhlp_005799 [Lomentospora prolificans]
MAALLDSQTLEELQKLYSAEDRKYHSLEHINSLLSLLQEHKDLFEDPEAVEAAIWFHDAIYDAKATDNEARSAQLALERLNGSESLIEPGRIQRICTMIEATATHKVPEFPEERFVSDAEMFLDMDLSILGAEKGIFANYEAAVRQEYAWVSDDEWRKGRAAVLTSFLERPYIFYSRVFRDELEQRARENISSSLEKLDLRGE